MLSAGQLPVLAPVRRRSCVHAWPHCGPSPASCADFPWPPPLPSPPAAAQPPNFQFHDPQGPIYTSPRFLPPAKVRTALVPPSSS